MRAGPIAALIALAALAAVLTAACGGSSAGGAPRVESTAASIETLAALQQENGAATGISVSGQGVAVAVPDVASLALGVSSRAATATGARDDAAARMTDLIASLKANGIADKDFHTTQFSIEPEIDYRSGEQVILGYRVTSMLAVTVRDLDRVGEVIDDAVDAVGDPIRVQGVSFSIEDADALEGEARSLAMADALAKAEQLAELAGVQLGKPTAISESSGGGLPPVLFHGEAQLREDETPISPGQLEITVNVQISYTIS